MAEQNISATAIGLTIEALKTTPLSAEQTSVNKNPSNTNDVIPKAKDPVEESFIKPSSIGPTLTPNSSLFPVERSHRVFKWLIQPIKVDEFFEKFWENSPLCIKRKQPDYYQQILTVKDIDLIIRKNSLYYNGEIGLVSHVDGKSRKYAGTHRATSFGVWKKYRSGSSIVIRSPERYNHKLHSLLTGVQEFFGGSTYFNAFLTPADSQCFSAHYDLVDAFVLQLEGRKHWKLYAPRSGAEVLPRYETRDVDPAELGDPIKEVTLEAGDILYFPRGTIHEAYTDAKSHSLHLTMGVYEDTTYYDLLKHIFESALETATRQDVEFRKAVPLQYLRHTGYANAEKSSQVRTEILTNIQKLAKETLQYVSADAGADRMGKEFVRMQLPPVPSKLEKLCMFDGSDMLPDETKINLATKVRLFRYHCLRLVLDDHADGTATIYYSTDNTNSDVENKSNFLDIPKASAPAVTYLLNSYPYYIKVKSLPLAKDSDKLEIATDLWNLGVLVTYKPLNTPTN